MSRRPGSKLAWLIAGRAGILSNRRGVGLSPAGRSAIPERRAVSASRDRIGVPGDPGSIEPPHAPEVSTLSPRARRLATWGLLLLSMLLIADAPLRQSPVETAVDANVPLVDPARPAVRAALIAHLEERHSSLSVEERERVVAAVLRSSRRYDLDPYLVTAVLLVESDARPWAESGKGAIGLMQVMPYWADRLALAGNLATIESNVEAGCFILADNIRRLGESRGISSYFWGRRIRGRAYLEKVERARARVRSAETALATPRSASVPRSDRFSKDLAQ